MSETPTPGTSSELRLFNTASQSVEPLGARDSELRLYVCGITPYDTTHLGHAFTYAAFDVLVRYLELHRHPVTYVQNVTDIDDDILRKAAEVGEDWHALGSRWTRHYIRDMQALNVRPPDHFVRATSVIPAIIVAVERLLALGVAYAAGGNVYFSVAAWPNFGKLSHLPPGERLAIANERGNRPDDPHKRDPLDFVLWQAQAPGEPAWPSLWGPGRPGWHIECSTIVAEFLGLPIEIHGGGSDLIFPHHEAEQAQAEAVSGARPFSRFWLHTAMVQHEGEKMSKSLGNLIMVADLLERWSPDALRLYFARHHYRQPWSHDEHTLQEAGQLAEMLRAALNVPNGRSQSLEVEPFMAAFQRAMNDDLNTPAALIVIESLGTALLGAHHAGRGVLAAQAALRAMSRVLGLRLEAPEPEERVQAGWEAHRRDFEDTSTR